MQHDHVGLNREVDNLEFATSYGGSNPVVNIKIYASHSVGLNGVMVLFFVVTKNCEPSLKYEYYLGTIYL